MEADNQIEAENQDQPEVPFWIALASATIDVLNRLSAFVTMIIVMFSIWPSFSRIEKAVVQQAADLSDVKADLQEVKSDVDESDQTLKTLLQHMKEPERWDEASQMINQKK